MLQRIHYRLRSTCEDLSAATVLISPLTPMQVLPCLLIPPPDYPRKGFSASGCYNSPTLESLIDGADQRPISRLASWKNSVGRMVLTLKNWNKLCHIFFRLLFGDATIYQAAFVFEVSSRRNLNHKVFIVVKWYCPFCQDFSLDRITEKANLMQLYDLLRYR